jgi:orotidine-5'-phosphate decarboxylase
MQATTTQEQGSGTARATARATATATASFGQRVAEAVGRFGPLCAGIDPSAALLESWGLPDDASGLRSFCAICVEALGGTVAVIKPQVAFFERHGSAGLATLERLLVEAREAGLLVLADAKRGDIDTTAAAYADAWLGEGSSLAADAVTVHPYLGLAALAPLITLAGGTGRGVIVVTRSSNPEGRLIQEAITRSGESVEESLLAEIAGWNESPEIPSGTVGAVVGATLERSVFPLSQLGGVILAPGLGAQGAQPSQIAERFGGCTPGSVIASTSRALLAKGPNPAELRRAASDLNGELAAVLG